MVVNTLLKVLEQLLHKIKANRRREMVISEKAVVKEWNSSEILQIMMHRICDALS